MEREVILRMSIVLPIVVSKRLASVSLCMMRGATDARDPSEVEITWPDERLIIDRENATVKGVLLR